MKTLLTQLVDRAGGLIQSEPILALLLGGALLSVFLSALFQPWPGASAARASLAWTIHDRALRLLWAGLLVLLLSVVVCAARVYLRQSFNHFQHAHGRVTAANFNAVQTIWGAPQVQPELGVFIYRDEEVTERIESEDLSKPALLRKKIVRRFAPGNPFIQARHAVTLVQNPRKKGSAYYGGYETDCRFSWILKNPAAEAYKTDVLFPLPAAGAVYDAMSATLNGADVLPRMEIRDASLALGLELKPGEAFDLKIAFKSRGLSVWYFQVREPREIRGFELTLALPDLAVADLNYPEGCMTPTQIQPGPEGKGSVLAFHLDHALSNKGMGVALPDIPQPGAQTKAVLGEVERVWMLVFGVLVLSLTLLAVPRAAVVAGLFGAGTALAYGLVGDFSDLLFGFWGTAAMVLLPMLAVLAGLIVKTAQGSQGKILASLYLVFAMAYPCLAGLDSDRRSLYFNLCAILALAFASRLLVRRWSGQPGALFANKECVG